MATEILSETPVTLVKFFDSPQKIFCCQCGVNSIPRPEGATASTRYTCPPCCDSALKSRDRETANTLAAIGAAIDARHRRETTSVGLLDVVSG
jgi:hypothetical protein